MTPETDAAVIASNGQWSFVLKETCQRLERERDEAREDAEHWKTEYLIVASRLCGEKHPRDNGIISEHEIIPKLERERDEAREDARLLAERLTRLELDSSLALAKLERERNELKKALEAAK